MDNNNLHIPTFNAPKNDDLFLASRNGLYTFGDLKAFQLFFLQFLFDYDLKPNTPVGFWGPSSDKMVFGLAACWQLGIPFVCFSNQAPAQEIQQQLETVKPGITFTSKENLGSVDSGTLMDIENLDPERALSTEINPDPNVRAFAPNLNADQIFGYFFTSGTTGKPKTVPLKRRQMYFAAASSANNFKPRVNHFWLLCLPLNHIGGISIILRSILYGSGIYRMRKFDKNMVSTFLSENTMFQAASLVPTMLKRLLDDPIFQTHKNFKAILLGGGPVDTDLLKTSTERGIPVVSSYGMTETCAQIAANPLLKPSGVYRPVKSVGEIFKPNTIEIRDENEQPLGANNPGTIWLKGPQVFDGYHSSEAIYSAFDEDGWFNTGDFGHINANGHLFIESRRTDLIITGGENVSPHEVEFELEKIDHILEAAVLGVNDKEWGQQVVAVVVAKTKEKLQTDDIQQKLKERIANFKIPKKIVQASTLPRTESGKIIREKLLELFD